MRRSRARWLAFAGLLTLGALAALVLPLRTSSAEPPPSGMLYLSITGDGPNAKAWYAGATPVGVGVQDALNTLSTQGWRLKGLVAGERPVVVTQGQTASLPPERTYLLILER